MNETIKSKTGKTLDEITLENVINGSLTLEDVTISAETLLRQGEIAEKHGRPQIKKNFQRAAELINVPDEFILKVYEMLRPNRATKKELLDTALILKNKYGAEECAKFILNAVQVYEKRGILKAGE
ncbi:diol dehydratase small subunit [Clostridium sp. SYSU_GA19001]|uniref:diol dehydratase small subunit n=1 Tax=Clostridium caldaquaticum TaxID=2940653 RepID=UPI002077666C|nr:diol dehydratase small subunit [Clostridium caldaquaticum]MCM8710031.1 diol dehydratase small subunit [Clostridium caldaquaticum]